MQNIFGGATRHLTKVKHGEAGVPRTPQLGRSGPIPAAFTNGTFWARLKKSQTKFAHQQQDLFQFGQCSHFVFLCGFPGFYLCHRCFLTILARRDILQLGQCHRCKIIVFKASCVVFLEFNSKDKTKLQVSQ